MVFLRLRQALVDAAATRLLAIGTAERHGVQALPMLDAEGRDPHNSMVTRERCRGAARLLRRTPELIEA